MIVRSAMTTRCDDATMRRCDDRPMTVLSPVLAARRGTIFRTLAPLVPPAAAALVLRQLPPSESAFYPRCPIYLLLHLQCPGCGGTRALAALLHARLTEALHQNALIVLLLPFAFGYGLLCYWRFLQRRPLPCPRIPATLLYAGFAVAAAFTILRNLPTQVF